MSAVLSPAAQASASADEIALNPTDAAARHQATAKALDLRAHAGGFHHRVVVQRKPAPSDVQWLLEQAVAGWALPTQARAQASRLLRLLTVQPWALAGTTASGGLGAPYQVHVKLGAKQAVLCVRCLPVPHVVSIQG